MLVESHDLGPRAGWRRAVKGTVVPRIVRGAAGVARGRHGGSAIRSSREGRSPERVQSLREHGRRSEWWDGERARQRRRRAEGGAGALTTTSLLSVARLVPEKGIDMLVRAIAAAGDERLRWSSPVRARSRAVDASSRRSSAYAATDRATSPRTSSPRRTSAADVFALLSTQETWGVVVNEAAASGLPLVLSDRVGAAYDLLRDGENGFLVPAGDVDATAEALKRLAADAGLRVRPASAHASSCATGATSRRSRASSRPCAKRPRGRSLPARRSRGPRTCAARPRRRRAPAARASLSSESTLPDRARRRGPLVGDDERLAVLEEACDAAAVGDDRPACRPRRLLPRPCRSSRPPRRARTRRPAGRGRRGGSSVTGRVWTRAAVASRTALLERARRRAGRPVRR